MTPTQILPWISIAGLVAATLPTPTLAQTGNAQTTVTVHSPRGDVEVTTDEAVELAGSVIESSLRGVGRMLSAMRGTDHGPNRRADLPDPAEIDVFLDDEQGHYVVTSADGGRVVVDAESGVYRVDARGAADISGALIEESLAAVGTMIRGLRLLRAPAGHAAVAASSGPLGLSPAEVDDLVALWRSEGLSQAEIDRRLLDLGTADDSFRAAMRQLDQSMVELDLEMERLQLEMERVEREVGDGGGR